MERRTLLRAVGPGVLAGLGAAGLSACARPTPVEDVTDAPFVGRATLRQRDEQIKRAGASLNWIMQDVRPGLIRGTLNLRTHQAVVDIPYTATAFSIHYVSSSNLDYAGGSINPGYNRWVKNLQQRITAESAV